MKIPCPFCGLRAYDEFVYGRPAAPPLSREQPPEAWYSYLYERDNPEGPHSELWYHQAGCRQWLIVQRNTATHQILTTELAHGRPPTADRNKS